ncbi:MAG: hypothetical protein ACRDJM_02430 [Actinomycetota bacterium]
MRKLTVLMLAVASILLLAAPASAHRGNHGNGPVDVTIPAGEGLPEGAGVSTMQNTFLLAAAGPCEGDTYPCSPPPRVCSTASRIDLSNGPAPGNDTKVQAIYFLPSDRTANDWDRPVYCHDGYSRESNIGYSIHHGKKLMASFPGHGSQVQGKFLDMRRRNITAYNHTYGFNEVIFIRAADNDAFFATNTFQRTRQALIDKSFNRTDVRYDVFADVNRAQNPDGSGVGGEADNFHGVANPKYASAYFRYRNSGQQREARWGCADEYDVIPMQEILHTFSIVRDGAPEGNNDLHVTQFEDVMSAILSSSYRGVSARGSQILTTAWDAGADSYTSQLAGEANYIVAASGYGGPYQSCPNVS